jgi:hypothetical protein
MIRRNKYTQKVVENHELLAFLMFPMSLLLLALLLLPAFMLLLDPDAGNPACIPLAAGSSVTCIAVTNVEMTSLYRAVAE